MRPHEINTRPALRQFADRRKCLVFQYIFDNSKCFTLMINCYHFGRVEC